MPTNKDIITAIFAETAKGNGRPYVEALADDAVWIAAESGGLARFDLNRERFDVVPLRDPDGGAPLNIWSLTIDGDTLWVGTRDRGLFARGAVAAAKWAAGQPPGAYDMQDVLGFRSR